MPCECPCDQCNYIGQCSGDSLDSHEPRECGESCTHYDNINCCCWQSGEWGLCLEVGEGDHCHLGYKLEEIDFR
jgi:hypothetical protein